jgi:hypothetical protein
VQQRQQHPQPHKVLLLLLLPLLLLSSRRCQGAVADSCQGLCVLLLLPLLEVLSLQED